MGCGSSTPARIAVPGDTTAKTTGSENGSITSESISVEVKVTESFMSMKKDFSVQKVLGRGSFGKVVLATRNGVDSENSEAAKKLYAIKILKKIDLYKKDQIEHTETERFILEKVSSPFIVKMYFAFSDKNKLYLAMDFLVGGELYRALKIKKKFDENSAGLIAAEVLLALEALHNADIIYRDMKPENIMIDGKGHVRLIDFGLAKIGVKGSGQDGDTNTFCGTSEYLAPEVIAKAGYGKAADWWAFGSILFEILTGTLPFIHQNPDKMYDRILNDPLEFPKKANSKDPDEYVMSYPAMDLLRGLLTKNISDRLGSNPTSSIDAIKKMPFFARFDFNLVLQMHYQPGYIPDFVDDPNLVHKNFDSEFTQESVDESYDHRKMRPSIELKTTFEGFDFDFGQKVVSSQ